MLYPLLLGAVYAGGMIMAAMGHGAEGGGFTSIEDVRTLFSADVGLLIGWTHYLVFILMTEMPHPRKDHGDVLFISCLDHFIITD